MKYFVEVVSFESGEVVKQIKCRSRSTAHRVDGGLNINLNHDEYYTRIVEEGKQQGVLENIQETKIDTQ